MACSGARRKSRSHQKKKRKGKSHSYQFNRQERRVRDAEQKKNAPVLPKMVNPSSLGPEYTGAYKLWGRHQNKGAKP